MLTYLAMFSIILLLIVRHVICNKLPMTANCDTNGLCVNNGSTANKSEEVQNTVTNRSESSSNSSLSTYEIHRSDQNSSHLISEAEFMSTSSCWEKLYFSSVNITKTDYEYFASFLNYNAAIKNKTEVAMLLTHIYRQTRGFDRSENWCAFKRCVKNETDINARYFGRGYIHLYGQQNYRSASEELFGDDTLLRDPDLVAINQTIAWETAFWFWMKYVHSVAINGFFGATIPMIWGDETCINPKFKGSFEKMFQMYVCIVKKLNVTENVSRDGCSVLSEAIVSVDNSGKSSVVIYITASISAFIFFVTTMTIIIYIRQRRSKSEMSVSLLNPFAMTEKNLEDIGYKPCYEFPLNRLIMKEELGSGFFGVVMKAKAIGLQTTNGDIATVAVKKVKEQFDSSQQAALLSELKIFLSLGKHLNIINFLGVVTKGDLMIIFEFCEYGNLREYLISHRDNFVNQLNSQTFEYDKSIKSEALKSSNDEELKTYDLICYSYQISQGMEYLSSRNVLHRDLAARNVLLTKGNIVKLCDFGLARDVYHYGDYCTTSSKQMPVKWMSIEAVKDRVFTIKNDVWAFGIVLWEVYSLGCDPYPAMQIDEEFLSKIINGYRMDRPDYCPQTVYNLIKLCWETDPNNRPNFELLTAGLRNILDESTRHYYLQLNDNYVKLSTVADFESNNNNANIYTSINKGFEAA